MPILDTAPMLCRAVGADESIVKVSLGGVVFISKESIGRDELPELP